MYSVSDETRKPIFEGVQGENEAQEIQFDVTAWVEELGEGVCTATAKRPTDTTPYPVTVTRSGNVVTWKPNSTDTSIEGIGAFQLAFSINDVVAKTRIWNTKIAPSLVGAGDPPDPISDYIDDMREIAAETLTYSQNAANSADAAQASADAAAESVASIAIVDVLSPNLFDKTDAGIEIGKYIDRTGTIGNIASNNYIVSGYIPIEEGAGYAISQGANVASQYSGDAYITAVFYDATKTPVWVKKGTSDSSSRFYTITAPDTYSPRYMRVNIYNALDTFMVVKGETLPNTYIPYKKRTTLAENIDPNDTYTNKMNPLWGKTAIFCGDSICEAIYDNKNGWAGYIGQHNNMVWKNYGVSGMTITQGTGHGSILNMSWTMETEFPDADYIIFEGGTNDADVIGSILNGNIPENFGSYNMTDYSYPSSGTTFCSAVERLFYRMITVWPQKKIGFIIAHKMGKVSTGYTTETNNRRAYFETIMALCKKWGIPYINLWDGCYLNPSIPTCYNSELTPEENRSQGYPIYDGQHLSTEGYSIVAPMIEAWMKTL